MYKIETPKTWKLIKPKLLVKSYNPFRKEGIDIESELVIIEFYSRKQLVNYISNFNNHVGTEFYNDILDNIGVNDNDMKNVYHWTTSTTQSYRSMEHRRCRVYDPYGNNVYDANFVREVENHTYSEKINENWWKQYKENNPSKKPKWTRWNVPASAYPEFRRGPMPYIHKPRGWNVYRGIKTFNEIKQTTDPEYYKEFTRKSRGKNLPTAWDEEPRDWRNDGWKSQGKHRHQWEHGVITKAKHTIGKHHEVVKDKDKRKTEAWENWGNWADMDTWEAWEIDNWDAA